MDQFRTVHSFTFSVSLLFLSPGERDEELFPVLRGGRKQAWEINLYEYEYKVLLDPVRSGLPNLPAHISIPSDLGPP